MRYLSLFSGIEAASVAWHPLGWQCVGVAEIDPFPCAVLKHHYPDVPNLGSVTDITDAQVEESLRKASDVDLLDEAADLIGAVPDAGQREELGAIYRNLREEMTS